MAEKEERGSTRLALKAGAWYVVSNFLVKGITFITTPIFARLMSSTDYGEFSNFASWQSVLCILTGAELYSTLSRAYYDYTEEFDQYASSIAILSCGINVLFYFVFMTCGSWIYNVVAIPKQYVHLLFVFMIFQACKEIFMARERVLYHYKSVAAITVINLVFPIALSVMLVILAAEPQRLDARIYGFYVPSAMIGLACGAILLYRGRTLRLKYCKYALKLSLPLLVHYLTAYLLTATNTIVTKSVLGAEPVALVSITTSVIHILTILTQAMSAAVTTWLMDNMEQKNVSAVRRGLLLYTGGIAVVAVGVMLLGPEVIWILGGTKYMEATVLLPGMITAVAIQAISSLFTIILTYKKQVVGTAVYTAIIAGVSVVGKVLLLPVLGIQALPWINIAAFGTLYLIDYMLVRKAGYSDLINMEGFNLIILIIGIVMISCALLYQHAMLRYGIIFGIASVIFILICKYRKLLFALVTKRLGRKS